MNPFVGVNIEFLKQAQRLIDELSDDQYQNNDLPPFNSGVGKHIRHVLDFYRAFLNRQQDKVNYDQRVRQPEVEVDRSVAIQHIEDVCQALAKETAIDAAVWSKNDEAVETPADQGYRRSTIGRELQFLVNHTVHHYAVIAILLHGQGFKTPQGFGVAISTLAYWDQKAKALSS